MRDLNLEKLKYRIPFTKSDGCVLINAKEWEDNTTQLIQSYNMKGERSISYINRVLKTNYSEKIYGEELKEGDLIFLTRQASRISYLKPFKFKGIEGDFANVHVMQVIGKFTGEETTYENFTPIYNKVFMKKIVVGGSSILDLGDSCATTIGEVLKVGTHGFTDKWEKKPLEVKVGQKVLIRDNITTEINLSGEDYIATEDVMCVGYFKDDEITFDNLTLYDKKIILEKYEDENVDGSSLIMKPFSVDDDCASDISELYQDNRFRILKVGSNVKGLQEGDKVLISQDFLNYLTFEGKKYYLLDGTKYINAKFN